jgi:hypothetical protein
MTADVVTFPSKPRPDGQKPVDEDLVRRVTELYYKTPVRSMAQNVRSIDCLKSAKPRSGKGKLNLI